MEDLTSLVGEIKAQFPLGGGNFVPLSKIEGAKGDFVLKGGPSHPSSSYIKEAHGLEELGKIKDAPDVVEVISATRNYILLKFIPSSSPKKNFFTRFGHEMAHLHLNSSKEKKEWGFFEDNFLGASSQINQNPNNLSWDNFFWQNRLLYQCQLGVKNGLIGHKLEEKLVALRPRVCQMLATDESPSLIHGDLWSRNFLVSEKGGPCLIDPATYYGHREAELAMCHLFGGFPPDFFHGYEEVFPLEKGHQERRSLYQLYHLLNHLNLFGKSYSSQVEEIVKRYS